MNKTRKLTQGAMLLAIVGALMVLDRQIGYWFSFLISMMFAVIIVVYSSMYEIKDGLVLAVALAVLTILLGDPEITYVYYPISTITGIGYSYGLKHNWNKRALLIMAVAVFIVGEVVLALVINPLLFNLPIDSQVSALKEMLNPMFDTYKKNPQLAPMADETMKYITGLLPALFMISVVFSGFIEGVLIHLMSILILKKFNIKDIPVTNIVNSKPNAILAYVCMISIVLYVFFASRIKANETLMYIAITVVMFAGIVLIWYGYIYFIIYGRVVLHKNISFILIICIFFLTAVAIPALIIFGFLYAAGPLYDKLHERIENEKNNSI